MAAVVPLLFAAKVIAPDWLMMPLLMKLILVPLAPVIAPVSAIAATPGLAVLVAVSVIGAPTPVTVMVPLMLIVALPLPGAEVPVIKIPVAAVMLALSQKAKLPLVLDPVAVTDPAVAVTTPFRFTAALPAS